MAWALPGHTALIQGVENLGCLRCAYISIPGGSGGGALGYTINALVTFKRHLNLNLINYHIKLS